MTQTTNPEEDLQFFRLTLVAFRNLSNDSKHRVLRYFQLIYEQEAEKRDAKNPN